MQKLCISFVFLSAVLAPKVQAGCTNNPPATYNEQPCLSSGGICVVAKECPKGSLAKESGLCPEQQPRGVECCHGLPISEKRCRPNGGECMPLRYKCPDFLIYKDASDCLTNEHCCILV